MAISEDKLRVNHIKGNNRGKRKESDSNWIEGLRNRYSYSGDRSFSEPREMHNVKCSDCGNECQVPFKPAEGKPVYCRECYRKHKVIR